MRPVAQFFWCPMYIFVMTSVCITKRGFLSEPNQMTRYVGRRRKATQTVGGMQSTCCFLWLHHRIVSATKKRRRNVVCVSPRAGTSHCLEKSMIKQWRNWALYVGEDCTPFRVFDNSLLLIKWMKLSAQSQWAERKRKTSPRRQGGGAWFTSTDPKVVCWRLPTPIITCKKNLPSQTPPYLMFH